ncbi:uncharacterized protein BO72DRAFT_498903 [Aspergillus fijiensis CBS 313.89]|uniref:Transmembrane protein n=1 Tax=Aspergillus fijiensis CBS 313.89 TaxID=1448319 RepID=A0A8G1VW06_9EURO|nr:uncharacterized protein BO72DRAFT_498903 [Aspergillus fijiensis CBS 313.89]RAK74687.1 hypothetical protein BO72DRAFT_498903 [Aspergillus fijiensis CBS 313.89]
MFSRAFSRVPLLSSFVSSSSSSPKEGPVHPSEAATPSVSFLQPVTRVFSACSSFFLPVRSLEGASPRSILVKPVDGDVRKVKPKKKVSWAETNTVTTVSRWLVPGVNVWSDEDLTDPSIREFDMVSTRPSTPVRSFNPHALGALALLGLCVFPLITMYIESIF